MLTDYQFAHWESEAFGSGYGSGEEPIMEALQVFFNTMEGNTYSYGPLEDVLGEVVTWLLINALARMDVIEWGTSSRYGYLTDKGQYVRDYVLSKSVEDICIALMQQDQVCVCNGELDGEDHKQCGKNPSLHTIKDKDNA